MKNASSPFVEPEEQDEFPEDPDVILDDDYGPDNSDEDDE